jgi:hypothetical protein
MRPTKRPERGRSGADLDQFVPANRDAGRCLDAQLHALAADLQHGHCDAVVDADRLTEPAAEYQHLSSSMIVRVYADT